MSELKHRTARNLETAARLDNRDSFFPLSDSIVSTNPRMKFVFCLIAVAACAAFSVADKCSDLDCYMACSSSDIASPALKCDVDGCDCSSNDNPGVLSSLSQLKKRSFIKDEKKDDLETMLRKRRGNWDIDDMFDFDDIFDKRNLK